MKKMVLIILFSMVVSAGCTQVSDSDTNRSKTSLRELTKVEKQLIESGNDFSYELFQRTVKQDSSKNIFISPLSASLALGMTLNGAAGETRQAMEETLYLQGIDIESINEAYSSLIELLIGADPKVKIKIANSMWLRQGFEAKESFKNAGKKYFKARIETLDFSEPSAAKNINRWVSDNTEGLIDQIIQGPIPREMVMYLINAIYFKGDWLYRFEEKKTAAKKFSPQTGIDVKVAMMRQKNDLAAFVSDEVKLLDLPYGDSLFTMTLMMPADEEASINAFIQNKLTEENVKRWISEMSIVETIVELPKFEVSYKVMLNDILSAMGMAQAFSKRANFSNINSQKELFISEVKQKAFVKVNEKGTEAAVATSVGVGVTSMPQYRTIKFNRPFVFMIRERNSGAILFIGKVANPAN